MKIKDLIAQLDDQGFGSAQEIADEVRRQIPSSKTTAANVGKVRWNRANPGRSQAIGKAWGKANAPVKAELHKDWQKTKQAHYLFSSLRSRVARLKRRGKDLAFDLTIEWIDKRLSLGCELSGRAFEVSPDKSPWQASVDKIDPMGGYTQDNCRLICWIYNAMLQQWSDDVMYEAAEALLANR